MFVNPAGVSLPANADFAVHIFYLQIFDPIFEPLPAQSILFTLHKHEQSCTGIKNRIKERQLKGSPNGRGKSAIAGLDQMQDP